ncbi:Protein SOSEKI 1 [Coemansia helicoidea]|uniref:Protein SOSEKI 1 n=1 Tax=Coemansia helicoidea TaxID=1286919 RepID=A0ACC1L9Z6_9FUNG|nr:Protein SOSEKI 1 [Coemansia helicoidea]
MPEPFAAPDSDCLATHHRRATAARDDSPHAPSFLPTGSPGSAADETAAAPATTPVVAAAAAAAPTSAPCAPGPAAASAADAGAPITTRPAGDTTAMPPPAAATAAPSAQGCRAAHSPLRPARGIKRRGSDSCIVLMAIAAAHRGSDAARPHSPARKRRSLEAPPAAGAPARHARPSAAPVACAAASLSPAAGARPAATAPAAAQAPVPRLATAVESPAAHPLLACLAAESRCPAAAAPAMPAPRFAQHMPAAAEPADARPTAPAPAMVLAQAQALAQAHAQAQTHAQAHAPTAYALPPINRYTLRELKIHNILQNPRLRHEVLFEPKLEFRPNSSGQLAEAKQRAAMQYWAGVDYEVRAMAAGPTAMGVATVTMLLTELREIVAEMAEDSTKPEHARHADLLRERIDEDRIRQQLAHGVFDATAVMACLTEAMLLFAQPSRHPAVARLATYLQRGRLARALRGAFDVLEAIKIDTANSSIELYREYMRSTAVAFERSHFNLALRRGTVVLNDTTDWWRCAFDDARAQGRHQLGLDAVFLDAARDLVLDDSQPVPSLFRMDEARIMAIRREAERLAILGMVFLSFSQFLQLAARTAPGAPSAARDFVNARGRLDHERLAAECLLVLPEGCGVQWTESLIAARSSPKPAAAPAPPARGDIGFSQLVADLVVLAERALGRVLAPAETAALERTLLRAARHECPLREIVEERVVAVIGEHTSALAALGGKARGTECEAMPASAAEILRRSMLLFLAPALGALSVKIHAVVSHHWQVYKAYYATVLSSSRATGPSTAGVGDARPAASDSLSAPPSASTVSAA